ECGQKGGEPRFTPVAPLAPLAVSKVAFQIPTGGEQANNDPQFHIVLSAAGESKDAAKPSRKTLAEAAVALKRVGPHDVHIRTFRSNIDGGVQCYAVRPAAEAPAGESNKTASDDAIGMIV